jgi:hypothetical protein
LLSVPRTISIAGGRIVIWNVAVAVTVLESVTITDTLEVPAELGDPVMTPVAVSQSPVGSELLDATAQVYVPLPPLATSGVEYAAPTYPVGSGDLVVIASGGFTVI